MSDHPNKDIINAKDEFLSVTKNDKIIASVISFGYVNETTYRLPLLYTQKEYDIFLERINRTYNSGYGGQELFGIIFCENGVWFERHEYDGSEWWVRHQYPDLRKVFGEDLVLRYERSTKLKQIDNQSLSPNNDQVPEK